MNITLYTLPNCGICNMVKTKLKTKKIPFQEKNFENIAEIIQSNRAPALKVIDDFGNQIIYNSPTEIVHWLEQEVN